MGLSSVLGRRLSAVGIAAGICALVTGLAASPAGAEPLSADSAGIMIGTLHSEGADLTIDGHTYAIGEMHGIIEVEKPRVGTLRANFRLSTEDDSGELGRVVITAVDHSRATSAVSSLGDLTEAISVRLDKLPGADAAEEPVTLRSSESLAGFTTKDAATFPPVNQAYRLRNPIDLYTDDDGQPAATLEDLEATINQTA